MLPIRLSEIEHKLPIRFSTGLAGFDRILGGGIVRGSTLLLAGMPGAGKSTLVLQLAEHIANSEKKKILYVSGEENNEQIKLRADRLSVNSDMIFLFGDTQVERIIHAKWTYEPDLIIVDSLQMLYTLLLKSSPGSPTQIRNGLLKLSSLAKETGVTILFIGQSTKGGFIAGLQSYQHTVDTVLYLGIDEETNGRFLEAKKNRFGAVGEIWRIQMTEAGLVDTDQTTSSHITKINLTSTDLDKLLEEHPLWSPIVKASISFLKTEVLKRGIK